MRRAEGGGRRAEGGGRTITLIESIKIAEKKLEDDEEISANRRAKLQHTIAEVYQSLGSYNAAITIMEKYRDPYLEGGGTDDEHMIGALSDLASYYSDSRRDVDAQELRERVLTSSRERLGSDHPETLTALHTLALSYQKSGRSEEARAMIEEALAKSRTINGPEHGSTLSILFALYGYYNGQEGLEKSIELLEIFNRVYGAEHPMSLYAMDRVANSLRGVGRVEESVTMCEELLGLRRKVIGSNHPDTLGVMNDLSFRYAHSGRLEEAIEMGKELVELARNALGPDHTDTLTAMHNLGIFYAKIGSMEEAVATLEEALTLRKKVIGLENPLTLLTMQNLGACYAEIGSNDRAITLLEESLLLRKKVLGPKHPDTLHSMHELAQIYRAAGLQDKALVIDEEVWELMGYLRLNADSPAATSVLIEPTSTWCWIHPVDGVDPMETVPDFHRTFFNADYDDASWQTGRDGEGTSGYLGTILTAEVRGVRMKSVMVDSPAARGGLLARDLIRMLDGEPFADLPAFRAMLAAKNPGDQVILSVVRGDESKELTVTLGSSPDRVGFGYGDEWFEGVDIGTPNEKALGKSAYLRHRFTTEREHTNLELRCRRDDGIIVYLDGKEVGRDNMEDGEDTYELSAAVTVGGFAEAAVFRIPLDGIVLPAGEHVLAISLHNTEAPSSDLRIGQITLVEVE
ncbi:MAG: tetratricopeptide (TPR) repeat protein [Verrucomicrobiales bacterium]